VFHVVFQLMIFAALLESGTGFVHAINERLASVIRSGAHSFGPWPRLLTSGAVLVGSVFVASRFGLVALIARGYRFLAYMILTVYVVPLLTYGIWWLVRNRRAGATPVVE
jgi:uncharacterized membrane protein YkvI